MTKEIPSSTRTKNQRLLRPHDVTDFEGLALAVDIVQAGVFVKPREKSKAAARIALAELLPFAQALSWDNLDTVPDFTPKTADYLAGCVTQLAIFTSDIALLDGTYIPPSKDSVRQLHKFGVTMENPAFNAARTIGEKLISPYDY